jgi:hypothetical protein
VVCLAARIHCRPSPTTTWTPTLVHEARDDYVNSDLEPEPAKHPSSSLINSSSIRRTPYLGVWRPPPTLPSSSNSMRLFASAIALTCPGLVRACGGVGIPKMKSMEVTPANAHIPAGTTTQLTATAIYSEATSRADTFKPTRSAGYPRSTSRRRSAPADRAVPEPPSHFRPAGRDFRGPQVIVARRLRRANDRFHGQFFRVSLDVLSGRKTLSVAQLLRQGATATKFSAFVGSPLPLYLVHAGYG